MDHERQHGVGVTRQKATASRFYAARLQRIRREEQAALLKAIDDALPQLIRSAWDLILQATGISRQLQQRVGGLTCGARRHTGVGGCPDGGGDPGCHAAALRRDASASLPTCWRPAHIPMAGA